MQHHVAVEVPARAVGDEAGRELVAVVQRPGDAEGLGPLEVPHADGEHRRISPQAYFYRDRFGLSPDDFPGARDCDANTMAIPLHNRMSDDDCDYVIETLCGLER